MAAAAAAALLDELMGRDRNLAPTEKKPELRWNDHQVCKHFLVKFCPNELFINTRADLGPCDKIHDDSLKKEYEKSSSFQKMGYEDDFIKFCQGMLADVERRIRRGKQRLSLGTQEGGIPTPTQVKNNDEQIKILTERINGLLEQVETLGCEGKVEEAQGIMKLCDQLKDERENLRKANENSHWFQTAEIAAAQEKQMEVCEVCGAFLIVGDAQQRVDDHLMGKQHVGYAKIKAALEEILEKRQKEKEEREKLREKEREERMNKRKEYERQRDKEMEDRRKKREDDRRRERKRSRSKSRDRRRRSRSRDRRKSRSHSRERNRSHSRNRGHHRRSHAKDKKRSRSRSRGHDRRKSRHSQSRSRSRERRRSSRDDRRKDRDHKQSRRKSHDRDSKEDGHGSPARSEDTSSNTEHGEVAPKVEGSNGEVKPEDMLTDSNSSPLRTKISTGSDVGDGRRSPQLSRRTLDGSGDATVAMTAPTEGNSKGAICEGDSEQ